MLIVLAAFYDEEIEAHGSEAAHSEPRDLGLVASGFHVHPLPGAPLTGVHVGHDADLGSCGHVVIAHSSDLLDRFVLDDLRVADRSVYFSFDFYSFHILFLSF